MSAPSATARPGSVCTEEWWEDACAKELIIPAEVRLEVPSADRALSDRISIVDGKVFAARAFSCGEVLLAEMAILFADGAADLTTSWSNSSVVFAGPFASTAGHGAAIRVTAQILGATAVHGDPPVAAASKINAVALALRRSGIACSAPVAWLRGSGAASLSASGQGLFLRSSLIPHSCFPNAFAHPYFDVHAGAPALCILAARDIARGEAIALARVDPLQAREARRAALRRHNCAPCSCCRCELPYDDTAALLCSACVSGAVRIGDGVAVQPCAECGAVEDAATLLHRVNVRTALLHRLVIGCSELQCGGASDAPEAGSPEPAAPAAASDIGRTPSARSSPAAASEQLLALALHASEVLHPADTALLLLMHRTLHAAVDPSAVAKLAKVEAAARSSSSAATLVPATDPVIAGAAASGAVVSFANSSVDGSSSSVDGGGGSVLLAAAVALSQRILDRAAALAYLPPATTLDLLVDHGLLCGLAACPERGVAAWRAAAELSRRFNALASPLHELYEAFERRPPRTPAEAAVAHRMRAVATANTAV